MRLKWKFLWLAIPAAGTLLGAGCSGINTGASVSPASFLVPGLLKNDAPAQTNAPDLSPEFSKAIALGN